ncbi:mediator of RNA polymerase II transcription subunit 30-like [Brachionus plicatilis]|uniref:Mediator of RNA polymerase II transcription subunit 30-like n=1 Tax=Brachionus plicatilis TaxID=10195 RepID=A0A3M7R1H1_BRAPC|nr:mediator of RNA polymerase II transcription subunit 30-like [Brachionus plicatilis]
MQSIPQNESQFYDEFNRLSSFELCITSQELVQELIAKTSDLDSLFRPLIISLLYGDQNNYLFRKNKTEETLANFNRIFARLRTIGRILHQRKISPSFKQLNGSDPNKLELYQAEKEKLIAQIKTKNTYIKEAIDRVSDIIWQINSVQTLKQ